MEYDDKKIESLVFFIKEKKDNCNLEFKELISLLEHLEKKIWYKTKKQYKSKNNIDFKLAKYHADEIIWNCIFKYDCSRKIKFTTYIYKYIEEEYKKLIFENGSNLGIKVPEKISRYARKVKEKYEDLCLENSDSEKKDRVVVTSELVKEKLKEDGIELSVEEIDKCLSFASGLKGKLPNYESSTFQAADYNQNIDYIFDDFCGEEKLVQDYLLPFIDKKMTIAEIADKTNLSYSKTKRLIDTCNAKIVKKQLRSSINQNDNSAIEKYNIKEEYEYDFSLDDRLKIGKNIKAIRESYGCKNHSMLYVFLNSPKGLSDSKLRQIEDGSYKPYNKSILIALAKLFGITYSDIVYNDVENIVKKDEHTPKKGKSIQDQLKESEDEIFDEFIESMIACYPFYQNNGIEHKWESIIESNFDDKTIEKSIRELEIDYKKTKNPEICANIISLIMRIGFFVCCQSDDIGEMIDNRHNFSELDFFSQLYANKNIQTKMENQKKKYLEKYGDIIDKYISELNKKQKCMEYLQFIVAMRYCASMLDNSEYKLSDHEMHIFGYTLLMYLNKIGNKFAKKLFINKQ